MRRDTEKQPASSGLLPWLKESIWNGMPKSSKSSAPIRSQGWNRRM